MVCELTNACNLSCIMCGRNAAEFHPTRFKLEWLQKLSPLFSHSEEITLMGWGEPTIHPDFTEILKYVDQFPLKKYFCTNGMKLDELTDAIFTYHVDIIAVSLDGSTSEMNDRIRKGGSFQKITESLRNIISIRNTRGLTAPYINFVFTAMKDNYHQIPEMIDLAADIGLDEVKVVYFTSFRSDLDSQTLFNMQDDVRAVFEQAAEKADSYDIKLKLPYIQGEDPVESEPHRPCYVGWRDLFIGSDGYIRPCMSTPLKFLHIDEMNTFDDLWNHPLYQSFRTTVNDSEAMPASCKTCYQSSVANWNLSRSFIQHGLTFGPEWEDE
ncbi:MAG: radical SAM protein [Methanocorpusculum sp.]|nr:radical SAM protein [Methanocorpusculum sp.]MDE2524025.1 radical SAM protein [Methanocorpusculum sp.]